MMKGLAVLPRPSRSAPFPPFDSTKINVSELPDPMRPKHYGITADGDVASIDWVTQDPWSAKDLKQFVAALINAFRRNGCYGHIVLDVRDRDNTKHIRRTITVKGGTHAH